MNNAIEINGLWFSYGENTVLQEIYLTVNEREFLGIIGPNGAGKTTLIKLILGLLNPTRGDIKVLGGPPRRSRTALGYVPQISNFDSSFPITVMEVVMSGIISRYKLMAGFSKKDKKEAACYLEIVGMSEYAHRQFGELSGGQRQRVLLARALVSQPQILLLDEPSSGLDKGIEYGFYERLKELKKSKTIIMISHDIGVISSYVDKIACLNKTLSCHDSKEEALKNLDELYKCPVDVIAHGIPHRVLGNH